MSNLYEFETENFTLGSCVNGAGQRLPSRMWFEHKEYGDEYGGGLWFDFMELIDYDGCGVLPKEILDVLDAKGFDVKEMMQCLYPNVVEGADNG